MKPGAVAAWKRIIDHLQAINEWDDLFLPGVYVCAVQANMYIECTRLSGIDADVIEDCRQVARDWLEQLHYPLFKLAVLDAGVDVELRELCAPLTMPS